MNGVFKKLVRENSPTMNPNVLNGTAKVLLENTASYLSASFMSGLESLHPDIDLTFQGARVLTPEEEYRHIVTNRNTVITYDLARNDVVPMEIRMGYDGEMFIKYLYVLFASKGNILYVNNTPYHITYVLSDTILSQSYNAVFVRLIKAKMTFQTSPRNFIINGVKGLCNMIYCDSFNIPAGQIKDRIGRPLVSVALYSLGEHGLRYLINKYCETDNIIICTESPTELYDSHIVFASTKNKPLGLKEKYYSGHDIHIAVLNTGVGSEYLRNLLSGIMYTLDLLPDIAPDLLETVLGLSVEEEKTYWRMVMGRAVFKDSVDVAKSLADVDYHYERLDGYVDSSVRKTLNSFGINVSTFYELTDYILTNFDYRVGNCMELNAKVDNKYVDIMYYLLYDTVTGFNRMVNILNKRRLKTKHISLKEVAKIFSDNVSRRMNLNVVKSSSTNMAISPVDCKTDLIYPKITSSIEDQSMGQGVTKKPMASLPPVARNINGGDVVFGSLYLLTKKKPSPRFKLNPYVDFNVNTGVIAFSDYDNKMVKELDKIWGTKVGGMKGYLHENIEIDIKDIK